jgi:Ca2+-binding RTX toxin-like protein
VGGAGDDTYIVDTTRTNFFWESSPELWNFLDTVTEQAGGGYDTVVAKGVYSAALPDNVEKMVMSGYLNPVSVQYDLTQDVRRKFTGNALDNVIDARDAGFIGVGVGYVSTTGYEEDEIVIDGGLGADVMIGAGVKTRFIVDNIGDMVISNSASTRIESYIDYTLAPSFQELTLVGSNPITGIGNALNNKLDGSKNSAANLLIGGMGDDTYVVGTGDVIQEAAGEGIDTVQTAASYTLGDNLENLTLIGSSGIGGYGNALDNVITGNAGDNSLIGYGGNDQLRGGAGNDLYGFNRTSGADVVKDTGGTADVLSFNLGESGNIDLLHFSRVGDDLKVAIDQDNSVLVQGWYASANNVIEKLSVFSSSPEYYFSASPFNYTAAQVEARVSGVNAAPVVNFTASMSALTNQLMTFQLAQNMFCDIESQFSMSYSATMADGSALPSWLSFDAATRTFTGTAPNSSIGSLSLNVTATDAGGLSASSNIGLTIAQGPILGTAGNDTINGDNTDNIIDGLAGDDTINGLGGDDDLYGSAGNDTLNGGTGVDWMYGGVGNDIYIVDNALDLANESVDEGTDEVRSSVSQTLAENVENLLLTGSAAISGTGNTLDNVLTGNSGNNTLTGLEGNDTLDGGSAGTDSLRGGLGNDTYIVTRASGITIVENAGEGVDTVRSSITYTLGSELENLVLTGTTAINGTGNTLDNVITGNSANNVLNGGGGWDTLIGGSGNDTYVVDNDFVDIIENVAGGTDLVQSSISYALPANVENLTLTGPEAIGGSGNALANTLVGNGGNNSLFGGGGNDTYSAGAGDDYLDDGDGDGNDYLDGGFGADLMWGGVGNDTYVVENVGDYVGEEPDEGTDLVNSSITYALNDNVENLTLTGTSAIDGTGNDLSNTLTGNSGANVLDGGLGADTMVGGAGNDTYIVDNAGDVVTEAASAGTDLVQSSVTYALGSNLENLTLTGTSAINGTGNALANILTGNSANNILDGAAGADTLRGGLGNDTYVVDNTGDVVTENASEGTDLVQSSVTYTLSADVENLTLTATTAINGTGNALDNILLGGSGANTLTGGAGNDTLDGGAGTDTMLGGIGNDVYYVDVAADVTTENANEGIDTVNSAVTRTLATNIELLFLTGNNATNGTGNTLANLLRGNTADNTLTGAGGTDILEGGAGNDTLSNTSGNTLLNGGAGADTLAGTANNDLLIGGTGNDALTTGQGADIIAFNKGDGQDTVAVSTTKDNTLSIGGGTAYADLLFQKSGNNLILKVGSADQITFTNYYAATANRSVNKLQVVLEGSVDYNASSTDPLRNKKIETFDFGGLVAAFDTALAANPSLTSWALSNALLAQYLTGSDTAALGGDLAYQYGRFGNEANVSYTPAIGILGSANFGTAAQTLQSLTSLQDPTPRLS